MAAPVFCSLFLVFLISGVIGDAPLSGESLFSFQTFGGFTQEPPSMWGAIPQTSAKEWTNLRDVFTVENWVYWEGPLTNPFDFDLEHEYKPILSRHPGEKTHNAWAHFHTELIWFPNHGATVLAFSGCGCEGIPTQFGGLTPPEHCDLGYVLRSDQGVKGPITYLRPKEWHHIAYTVDGDGTTPMATQTASLVVDGVLVDNITWPLTDACRGRPIPWQSPDNFGLFNQIAVGYLENDDVSAHGLNGRVDEVRIWNVARSPEQTKQTFSESLTGKEEGLVAYYTFNDGPQNGIQYFKNKVQLSRTNCGEPVGSPRPLDMNKNVWSYASGLSLTSVVEVKTSLLGEPLNPVRFELYGLDLADSPIDFYISEVSEALKQLIASGYAQIYDPRSQSTLNINRLPQVVFRQVEISVVCVVASQGTCSNIPGDLWIKYWGQAMFVPGPVTKVSFPVVPACTAELDVCGVCGGDNSSCQCSSYHQFGVNRMSYSLFTFTASQMSPLIEKIKATLNSSIAIQPGNADFEEKVSNLYETGTFHYGCMNEFSCLLGEFKHEIETFLGRK